MPTRDRDALDYHSSEPAGKIAITATKPCRTQRDLSLAYTPGVATPCLEIQRDPDLAYRYTAKVLFKRFADIDVFDIELATSDPAEVIRACRLLEPTFGGINLEVSDIVNITAIAVVDAP
jgi:malate dehydrogenase (oxaloacetate-decarboxylating)(NADP+)